MPDFMQFGWVLFARELRPMAPFRRRYRGNLCNCNHRTYHPLRADPLAFALFRLGIHPRLSSRLNVRVPSATHS